MLSKRAQSISPSMTLAITAQVKALRSQGVDVINFGAGEPDLPTPDFVNAAAKEAIDNGFTRYTPAGGLPILKEAVCRAFKRRNNLSYEPPQVVISCGAKHSLYNIMQAIVDDGDGVFIPVPYWVSYPEMVKLAGGIPLFIETIEDDNFSLTPSALTNAIKENPNAKALILNSPSNPTGAMYSRPQLLDILEVCIDNNILIISDEIYDVLSYEEEFVSFASLSDKAKEITITVNGVSKAYSMTGWRIGYAAGPEKIIKAVSSIQSHSTSNPTSISQYAAIAALDNGAEWEKKMKETYSKRAELVVDLFKGAKARVFKPMGTFYAFVDISSYGIGSLSFAKRLLEEAKVGVIPGIAFGADNWVRLSFAASEQDIKEGINRWLKWEKQ